MNWQEVALAEESIPLSTKPRIAVVVVHGVGDQKPLTSARAIGDLLQNIDVGAPIGGVSGPPCSRTPEKATPRYGPFAERMLRINVRPVVVRKADERYESDGRGPFHAWVHHERLRRGTGKANEQPWPQNDGSVPFRFMRGQLQCYQGEGPENTYETIRLESARSADTSSSDSRDRIVHVYELYWADLSRLKANVLTIFAELFQVILHLSSLGTHVVDAEASNQSHRSWDWFSRVQSWAVIWLTIPIPIINLFMLGVAAAAGMLIVFERLQIAIRAEVALTATAAAVAIGEGVRLWRARNGSVPRWILPAFGWVVVAVVGWTLISRSCGGYQWSPAGGQCTVLASITTILTSAWLAIIAGALVVAAIVMYDHRRPGANRWAVWLAAVLFPAALATLVLPSVAQLPQTAATIDYPVFFWFRLLECLYVSLLVAWGAFALSAIASWGAGLWALRHVGFERDADGAIRGRWTARLTLSLSAFSFVVITLAGWGLIETGLDRLLRGTFAYTPALTWFPAPTIHQMLDNLWTYGGGPALLVLLGAAFLGGLPAIWGLAPVVWSEVRPPDFERSRKPGYSERLGDWLTVTFKGLRISGRLLYVTMIFVVPFVVAWVLLSWLLTIPYGDSAIAVGGPARDFLRLLGSLSAALITWLFAMRGELKNATLGFRTVLDVLLDVDSWLREHPLDANPKARICGRYVSLLRYICQWRDPLDPTKGYDGIVIVAHSQGTAITADLLRFLKEEAEGDLPNYDPELEPLERMNVSLFTMGCPLRDLYALRFPRLYDWARHDNGPAMTTWVAGDLSSGLTSPPEPAPEGLLGVNLWVNAYRSGDYIGRYLWRTPSCGYLWTSDIAGMPVANVTRSVSSDGVTRMEFCIGAGAHTHYWDRTAPIIGAEIDRLIAQ